MREFLVAPEEDGVRLDRWLQRAAPGLSRGGMQKALRAKTVRVDGIHVTDGAFRLAGGSQVRLFLPDEVFAAVPREDPFLARFRVHLHVLYEDADILLADKKPGVLVHPDGSERVNTLLTHIQAYLYQKGEYSPERGGFSPALCNRIDRFTGGIVIAAKNEAALRCVNAKIASRQIRKLYLAAVHGRMEPPEGRLSGCILKREGSRRVEALPRMVPGGQEAITGYRTLAVHDGLSLVECELFTGRTHQIRAQMAAAGHPLLGDGQYGSPALDAGRSPGYQALYAWRVDFAFDDEPCLLARLAGRSFCVGRVAFADTLFPGFRLPRGG